MSNIGCQLGGLHPCLYDKNHQIDTSQVSVPCMGRDKMVDLAAGETEGVESPTDENTPNESAQETDDGAAEQEKKATSPREDDARVWFTQRMPEDIEARVQDFCEDYGMTRQGAVNMLVDETLNDRGY